MGKHTVSRLAKCPYYHYESIHTIFCEGVHQDTLVHLAFLSPKECQRFKDTRCREDYKKCPIYMAEEIYNEQIQ